jgi:hypothetical protein
VLSIKRVAFDVPEQSTTNDISVRAPKTSKEFIKDDY